MRSCPGATGRPQEVRQAEAKDQENRSFLQCWACRWIRRTADPSAQSQRNSRRASRGTRSLRLASSTETEADRHPEGIVGASVFLRRVEAVEEVEASIAGL